VEKLTDRVKNVKTEQLVVFLAWFVILGMVYSPFLLSVAMIGYGVIAFFSLKGWRPAFKPDLLKNFRFYLSDKAYLAISIGFFLVLLSGFFTEPGNFGYWGERIRLKIAFLLLPLAFASIKPISDRSFKVIMYSFVGILFFSCIGIGIHYLLNFDEINRLLNQGHPMPTPRNHIRFSLLLAYSIFAAFYLYKKDFYFKYKWERTLLFGVTGFLFVFLHLLSVRSGLAAFYLTAFILILRRAWVAKKIFAGVGLIVLMAAIPLIAYKTIPSFKAKVDYSLYDRWVRKHNISQSDYSDGGRFISIKVGMDIGNDNPVFGVGAGNLRQEVKSRYAEMYPESKEVKMPHNQFVSIYASMGIIGLGLFLFAFFFPLFYKKGYRHTLFLSFHIIVLLSFLVENTIENSIGIAFYLFFLLLNLNYQSKDRIPEQETEVRS
jgi:O-antigen ligase